MKSIRLCPAGGLDQLRLVRIGSAEEDVVADASGAAAPYPGVTMPICARSDSCVTPAISWPSIRIRPPSRS